MIEAIENMGLSFVRLAGEYLHGFEPHVAASTIRRRFVARFVCLRAIVHGYGY